MSKVNPYPHYSDFDQAWLGDLPLHWQIMRTKLLFDLVTEFAPVGNSEELLSVYTAIGVKPRKELEARGNKASSTDNYWRVHKGDIIVNKLLAWMGAIGISEYNGVTSPAYDILRPKENVNPYYYNFLFRNPIASREFKRHSRGIMDMRLRLYFTRFGDLKLPLPPVEEQVKIVEYLQFKLKRIDRFIRKKKQLVKLLNEQKATIINNAVTKGLNPKAKMKPSGIDWLGDIPEHWELIRLKYLTKITTGNKNTEDKIDNGEFDFYVRSQTIEKINSFSYDGEGILTAGDGVGVGKVFHYANGKFDYHQRVYLFYNFSVKIFGKFLFYYLRGLLKTELMLYNAKSTVDSVRLPVLKNFLISFPTVFEQIQIVEYIENEFEIIEKTISTIEKEIALTQEYRTALIAEAVTGKIDVRDFVIPEVKEEENYEELEEELNIAAEDEVEYGIMEEN
jgi:type I restriction enzyme S subunit